MDRITVLPMPGPIILSFSTFFKVKLYLNQRLPLPLVLLQEAQVRKEAHYIDIKGAYEKVVRIPLKELHQKKIFLAYRINGEPLPMKHGFPMRLVFEDAYGYDWVKYVEEIVIL